MRSFLPDFSLVRKSSLAEALALLHTTGGSARPMAGGTDLMVLLASGKLGGGSYVDLWNLDELRGIQVEADQVTFGALTTYSEIEEHPVLSREFPMLRQAASETGGWAIQNRGTVGGNVANASPAADSPPALLAYDAELELVSVRGARWVPYATFHTGYKTTVLAKDELIARFRVPRVASRFELYRKVGPRKAQAISKVCFAGAATVDSGSVTAVRIALGGVAPVVTRCPKTEALVARDFAKADVVLRAIAALGTEIAPIDDVRSNAAYRRRVAENILRDFVSGLRRHVGLRS